MWLSTSYLRRSWRIQCSARALSARVHLDSCSSVTISWDSATSASAPNNRFSSYKVEYKRLENGPYCMQLVALTDLNPTIQLYNLTPSAAYNYIISAVSNDGQVSTIDSGVFDLCGNVSVEG